MRKSEKHIYCFTAICLYTKFLKISIYYKSSMNIYSVNSRNWNSKSFFLCINLYFNNPFDIG